MKDAAEWLYDSAIPLWLRHGVDSDRGGFYGALDPETLQNVVPIKRLRVLTRQLYVFCEGARAGVPGAQEAVEAGTAYLFEKFANPDGGYAFACDLDGNIIDFTRDLYDLAFVLFAFSHVYRWNGSPLIRRKAEELLLFIEGRMRHPCGGFDEAIPARLPRRQNPHMHLFEAALAASEHFGDVRYAELCHEIADLLSRYFLVPEPGLILEYFEDDLRPRPQAAGQNVIEPGHHFEWIWLLSEYRRIFDRPTADVRQAAIFAMQYGLDRSSGLLFGELFEDGSPSNAGVRLWPHCEWLKAASLLNGAAGSVSDAWAGLQRFLEVRQKGLWFEQWNARERRFEGSAVPATSLYHLTSAIVAMTRSDAPTFGVA